MLNVDDLAQKIREVDGNHTLGAGALAEALMPLIEDSLNQVLAEQSKCTNQAVHDLHKALCQVSDHHSLTQPAMSVIRKHHLVINQADKALKPASAQGGDNKLQGGGL